MRYCEAIHRTKRRKTREVRVGHVGVGGDNPIRIQSMTTSDTRDVPATVEQIKRLADAGCEIARVTVQGKREADACEAIKNHLVQQGYAIPLVADIHFYPPAAMCVAEFVDKVRINPGNFVDRRASFRVIEYDDTSYARELERIEEKFLPLVEKCRARGIAMRIGTNHGSLSDRIMNRYGDTPRGMVESALEFTRVARKADYHDIIYSMKSSNPKVMIQAYRLLVAELMRYGWDYPLHLGVTEAGAGEDGRIKSAMGIGSLLLDGLGDTIRVSLTEDPWHEIDPCQRLVQLAGSYRGKGVEPFDEQRSIEEIRKRPVRVASPLHRDGSVLHGGNEMPPAVGELQFDALTSSEGFVTVDGTERPENWSDLVKGAKAILLAPTSNRLHLCRRFFSWLQAQRHRTPVILRFAYDCSAEDLVIHASAEMGALLCDGLGEGVCIEGPYDTDLLLRLGFSVLQAARMRSVKTEFISCPSCGRTLFDLQTVSAQIRDRTGHLPGVKVAIMGCIVNGPGEMADADFGYVGSKPDKIDLYVGKECVERDIDYCEAPTRLVELIRAHGKWVDACSR